MRTLVLNAGFEPVRLVSWQKALCLVLAQKAETVAAYDELVRSVSATYAKPSVVRLTRYVRQYQHVSRVKCTRKNIIYRDKSQCQYCGVYCLGEILTIDHVVPRSRGGITCWENVVVACAPCNRKKGSRRPEQIGMKLLRAPRKPSWIDLFQSCHQDEFDRWREFLAVNIA